MRIAWGTQIGIFTHSFARDPSALVAEDTRLLDHGPLCPKVRKFVF